MTHIFISYSKKNQPYARQLAAHIRQQGFNVWIDDRLDYGDEWERVIFQAIDACAAFIVIMTPESYASKWVLRECTYAEHRNKPLFPIFRDGEEPFPRYLTIQYADVTAGGMPPDGFFDRISDYIPRQQQNGNDVTAPEVADHISTPEVPIETVLEEVDFAEVAVSAEAVTEESEYSASIPAEAFIEPEHIQEDDASTPTISDITGSLAFKGASAARPDAQYQAEPPLSLTQKQFVVKPKRKSHIPAPIYIGGLIALGIITLLIFASIANNPPQSTSTPNPTIGAASSPTGTVLPDNCILHTLVEGDTPFGVAEQYGVDEFDLMQANNLNIITGQFLQIGDVLIVPLAGCSLLDASEQDGGLLATDVNTQIETDDLVAALSDFELLNEPIERIETDLGDTLVVNLCGSIQGSNLRDTLMASMRVIAQQSVSITSDLLDAIGVRIVECYGSLASRAFAVPIDIAVNYAVGSLDETTLQEAVRPVG